MDRNQSSRAQPLIGPAGRVDLVTPLVSPAAAATCGSLLLWPKVLSVLSFLTNVLLATCFAWTAAASDYSSSPPSDKRFLDSPAADLLRALPSKKPADTNAFHLRFQKAPISDVLKYLSEVAALIIICEQQPTGTIDLWTEHPVKKDEAIDLLNSVLEKEGEAAVLAGRKLKIISADEAKQRHSAIIVGSNPDEIPNSEKSVTQVIPVRFVEVANLLNDLRPLLSKEATLTANESANLIILNDHQGNIRRLAQIINAIDSSAEDPTAIKVFPLENSNPTEIASLLTELFPDQTSAGSETTAPFAGTGGPGPGSFGAPGGPGPGPQGAASASSNAGRSNSQADRINKRAHVIAQADERTTSVVVLAPQSLMPQVERVVAQIDSNAKGKQILSVYPVNNMSPSFIKQAMTDLFQKNGSAASPRSQSDSTQTDPLAARLNSSNQQTSSSSSQNSGSSGAQSGNSLGGFGAGAGGGGAGPQ